MPIQSSKAENQVSVKSQPAMQLSVSVISNVGSYADRIDLINHYAQKKENVIVHCMAASGCELSHSRTVQADSSAAPTADKCMELNMEADPNGERTMSKLLVFPYLGVS